MAALFLMNVIRPRTLFLAKRLRVPRFVNLAVMGHELATNTVTKVVCIFLQGSCCSVQNASIVNVFNCHTAKSSLLARNHELALMCNNMAFLHWQGCPLADVLSRC